MVKPAAFILLLAIAIQLTSPLPSKSTLRTAGKKFAAQGHYPVSPGLPLFSITPRLTKPRTTTTISISCPRKHTRFRFQVFVKPQLPSLLPFLTMPLLLDVEVSSTAQKCGFLTSPSVSTVASTASFGTSADGSATPVSLQRTFPPPGPRPIRTNARVPTKTHLAADRRPAQLLKQEEAEAKRAAVAARRIERETKKRERMISAAAQKAAKASAKADDLRRALQVAEAMRLESESPSPALPKLTPSQVITKSADLCQALQLAGLMSAASSHQKKAKGALGQSVLGVAIESLSYQSPQRRGPTANKRVSVRSPRHFSRSPDARSSSGSSSSSGSLSDGILTIGEDTDNDVSSVASAVEGKQRELASADGGYLSPRGIRATVRGGRRAVASRRSSSRSFSSTDDKESDLRTSCGASGEGFTSIPGVAAAAQTSDSEGDLSDASGWSIEDGVWPGSCDSHLLTRFVSFHFAGDWDAYRPFSAWAASRKSANPRERIRVSDWLDGQGHGGNGEEPGRSDGQGASGRDRDSGGVALTLNMCNKTCPIVSTQISEATSQVPLATPTPTLPPRSRHTDIRLLFPPVPRKLTPREQATDEMMERELEEQAAERGATSLRVQALRQKFEESARERLSSAGKATNPAGRKSEVHGDTDHPTLLMSETSLEVVSHHTSRRPPSRGSQHRSTTRSAREIERLSSQLQDQERIRDSSAAAAATLRQMGTPESGGTPKAPQNSSTGADGGRNGGFHQDPICRTAVSEPPGCKGTPEALPKTSTGANGCKKGVIYQGPVVRTALSEPPGSKGTPEALPKISTGANGPVHLVDHPPGPALRLHQGSRTPSLAADLALLRREGQLRSPAGSMGARPSPSTGDSLVSGVSSLSSPAVERASSLNVSRYSGAPHNYLPENSMEDSVGQDMFSMAHRNVPGSLSGVDLHPTACCGWQTCLRQCLLPILPDQALFLNLLWHTFLTLHHRHNQSEIITQLALGLVGCAAPHQEAMMVATL